MALIRAQHRLEQVSFSFDEETGAVSDIQLTVNYAVVDDAVLDDDGNPVVETRVRKTVSVWADLTAPQKAAADGVGKRLQVLAQQA